MSLSRKLALKITEGSSSLDEVILLLQKYKMTALLPSIKKACMQISGQKSKYDTLLIESPFPVSEDAIKEIKRIVGEGNVAHEVSVNPSLLAGFKARYKGTLYDGSAERIIKQVTGGYL